MADAEHDEQDRFEELDRPDRSALWRVGAVALAGLLLTAVSVGFAVASQTGDEESRFDDAADTAELAVTQRVRLYGNLLWGVRAYFGTTDFVTREQFATYLDAESVDDRYPGTQAVGFSPVVTRSDIPAFEQSVRNDESLVGGGYPSYDVHPESTNPTVLPVTYLEPLEGNEGAFGFDVANDDGGSDATERAVRSGEVTAGAPLTIVGADSEQRALVLYVALYDGGGVPPESDRVRLFEGIVLGLFNVDEMLAGIQAGDPDVRLEIYDAGVATDAGALPASESTLLYASGDGPLEALDPAAAADPHREVLVGVGNRRWRIFASPGSGFTEPGLVFPVAVGIVGLILTLLIAGLVFESGRSRRRARLLAEEMTSDLRMREQQLAQASGDIVRSNRDLERYATIAAHDLQEPLRSILAYSDLLNRRFADDLSDDVRDYVERMAQAAQRMRSLVTDLLAYARLETSEKRSGRVDLTEVVRAAVGDLTYQIEESGATVRIGRMPTVVGNERELIGVFANLLSNALKYRSPERRPIIQVGGEQRGDNWVIGVRDNGVGIAEDYHLRIFELFRRLGPRDDDSGTGLGLAICARTIAQHGGRIWVDSVEGEGATFWFTLPVKPKSTTRVPDEPS